ncbi:Imm32 family immunity protein [Planctomicrobium sp.]|jgi:hypothetical protein|nr:Imm32 family immunity protein [Planctomicrobium sp.]MDB4743693.1 Imm32 family immunity protein [Planctomicrobium sp.]
MSDQYHENSKVSVEWDSENEWLEIHGSSQALCAFSKTIETLALSRNSDHIHLMSSDWGGEELSCDQQNATAMLIHHVKVLVWK